MAICRAETLPSTASMLTPSSLITGGPTGQRPATKVECSWNPVRKKGRPIGASKDGGPSDGTVRNRMDP